ncbi:hypothetical protein NP233_g3835 [Leucocoprinus birnbaumii]|uniref:Uncharacterized protein n=1 Tax=Leucocoprinus birnbaumii TaxID=56174 RepID=A0AAD5YTI9_9AGAR|nr:hypothetical protein NP233_g3835 [Leucocoprinus birnbaumii]
MPFELKPITTPPSTIKYIRRGPLTRKVRQEICPPTTPSPTRSCTPLKRRTGPKSIPLYHEDDLPPLTKSLLDSEHVQLAGGASALSYSGSIKKSTAIRSASVPVEVPVPPLSPDLASGEAGPIILSGKPSPPPPAGPPSGPPSTPPPGRRACHPPPVPRRPLKRRYAVLDINNEDEIESVRRLENGHRLRAPRPYRN